MLLLGGVFYPNLCGKTTLTNIFGKVVSQLDCFWLGLLSAGWRFTKVLTLFPY